MEIESNKVVVDASSETLKQESSLLIEDINSRSNNSTVSSSTNIQEKGLLSDTLSVPENFIQPNNPSQHIFSENDSTESRS
jgi:hypothetical protein